MSTLKTNRIENLTTADGGISINNSGQVGIGTTSPDSLLEVRDSSGTGVISRSASTQSTDTNKALKVRNNNTTNTFAVSYRGQGYFAGDVGIGSSSPQEKLHVSEGDIVIGQSSGASTGIRNYVKFGRDTNPKAAIGFLNNTSNGRGDLLFMNSAVSDGSEFTDAEEVMRINSSGNVGIGTSSPTAPLHVQNNDNSPGGTIQHWIADTGTFVRAVSLLAPETDNSSAPFTFSTANAWNFRVDSTDALTINASGNVGIRTTSPGASLDVNGSLSKNSGSFKIDHPLPALTETHHLVHSFVEAPDASNLYAGMVDLVDGTATVNIDTAHRMTEGTFEALNTLQSWSSSNESGYAPVKCSVSGNILTIECQDPTSTDTVYYEVRGIRKDQHMLDTEWTDSSGKVITEPLKPVSPQEAE